MSCNPTVSRRCSACLLGAAAVALSFWSAAAQAGHISIPSLAPPGDVATFGMYVEYSLIDDANDDTGLLIAFGDPLQFDLNNQNISGGAFNLSMIVKRADGDVVSGTMSITGTTDGTPFYDGTLLTGNVVDFGFSDAPGGDLMEFKVAVTGGLLSGPYYTNGYAGIMMTIGTPTSHNFAGVFTSPFVNDGINGFSDTYPMVPEPSSLVLMALSFLGIAFHLRRCRRRPAPP